jgi:MoaA/NifB/PqqE/SkfB family radical SAM enzyme
MLNKIKEFCRNNKDLAGIIDGRKAFLGPELLQIDPTNSCNNNCIACWCRSPLLKDKKMSKEIGDQFLPLELVIQVLDDCASMGTTNIYIAGGGEPFMHPNLIEIIAHVKKLGMACHVNTNFTLVDKNLAAQLVDMGVDHLIVSLWAATPETYVSCHPNKTPETFWQLTDVLKYLVKIKQQGPLHIKLYNVIMNLNYHEIEKMVALAHDLGVNAAEFTVADVIPGYTDQLLLNNRERKEIVEMCEAMDGKPGPEDSKTDIYMNEFRRRVAETGAEEGEYDKLMLVDIPCVIGWNFARILANGNVNACLKAHRVPVGNVFKSSFAEIWNGRKQMEFRQKTRAGNPGDPFFSLIGNDADSTKIGCHRGCDDIERNRRLWARYNQLTFSQRVCLKGAGYYYRTKNLLPPGK